MSKFKRLEPSVYALASQAGLRTDMATRAAYSSDASIFRRVPEAVAEPKSAEDVAAAIQFAREKGWKVVGRGGGTSVAGNAIGEGLIIDTSRYFNGIVEVDVEKQTATVEPGVICDTLREAVAPYGLTYGPDPSTHSRCTIGGMVANNACGSHSVAYGTAAENLIELSMLLDDGREVTFSRGGCSDPEIEAALRELVAENKDMISRELGRFPRQVSGYGLHYLLDEHGFDTAKALAGSEGTLGVITKLKVKLVPVPKAKALAVLAFDSVFDAAAVAAKLRLPGVETIEGMGGDLLAALRAKNGMENAGENLPGQAAGGWLYCETGADSLEEAVALAEAVAAAVPTIDTLVVSDPTEMRALWRIREAAAGIVTRLPDGGEAWPNWEDSAVPPENLEGYLRGLYKLMEKYELRGIPFGHFGEGCVHVRISFDFSSTRGKAHFEGFMNEAAQLVASFGGSLSGEHGDGRARSALLRHMYSLDMLMLFDRFKSIFDPMNTFNPGVLVLADRITHGIRMESGQRKNERNTFHAFSKDKGSMVNAVNRCVGVSACRSESGAMCPSFQITGDENLATRGRARILSEMFRGESFEEGWRSEEVAGALDLCLSCKACASECPVNVDMATLKSEFLSHHYARRIRPMAHYVMGWLPLTGRLLHKFPVLPTVVDKVMSNKLSGKLVARVAGMDPNRPLIRFAHRSLQSWSKEHVSPARGDERTVVLWPDSFTSNLDIKPAKAAVDVLERLGYRVEIPQEFVCCGLTWHSTGQLKMTRRVLAKTAKVMHPYLDRGLPVIGLEPSCTAMLRHEAVELQGSADVRRLASATVSFAEFIGPRIAELVDNGTIKAADLDALTQLHCHERSMGDPTQSAELLRRLGVSEERIETGCCGLAGNWGFEPGHAEMSLALGERELFPKVREAVKEDKVVIADGFSCRTQVEQGTGVTAKHLAQVVLDILKKNGVKQASQE